MNNYNYDPLQTQLSQLSLGAYPGAVNPFGSPYQQAIQSAINPAAFNPLAGIAQNGGISPFAPQQFGPQQFGPQGYPGAQQGYGATPGVVPNYGVVAQQQQQLQQLQQLASILAAQTLAAQALSAQNPIPQMFGPAAQPTPWQNPPLNPVLAQQLAMQAVSQYAQPQIGQAGLPFGQTPFAQFGYPLAPQSWVGQAGQFGGGQIHPHHLSHLAARGLYQGQ